MWDDDECRERQIGARTLASSWILIAVTLLAAAAWWGLGMVVQINDSVLPGATAGVQSDMASR